MSSSHVLFSLVDSPPLDFLTDKIVATIKTEFELKKVTKDELPTLYAKYNVSSLPFFAFPDGNVIDSFALNFIFRRIKNT
jgi:thioredoxin-like negative regulator of GroEL